MKRLIILILCLMLLSSCTSVESPIESSVSNIDSSLESSCPSLNWGSPSDSLNTFTENIEYTMSIQLCRDGDKSKILPFPAYYPQRQVFDDLKHLTIQQETPLPPEELFHVNLFISDQGETTIYTLYENNDIYTEQNGAFYYLGKDYFDGFLSLFLDTAFDQMGPNGSLPYELPYFSPWDGTTDHMGEQIEEPVTPLDPSEYELAIVLTNYGDLATPIWIRDTQIKMKVLDCISQSREEFTPTDIPFGTGIVLRVFNRDVCYNYVLTNSEYLTYFPTIHHYKWVGASGFDLLYMAIANELLDVPQVRQD